MWRFESSPRLWERSEQRPPTLSWPEPGSGRPRPRGLGRFPSEVIVMAVAISVRCPKQNCENASDMMFHHIGAYMAPRDAPPASVCAHSSPEFAKLLLVVSLDHSEVAGVRSG
jgi:hypothetical protein